MFGEFEESAMKGGMFDLAVGVVVGAAFGKIKGSYCTSVIPLKVVRCPQCTSDLKQAAGV